MTTALHCPACSKRCATAHRGGNGHLTRRHISVEYRETTDDPPTRPRRVVVVRPWNSRAVILDLDRADDWPTQLRCPECRFPLRLDLAAAERIGRTRRLILDSMPSTTQADPAG